VKKIRNKTVFSERNKLRCHGSGVDGRSPLRLVFDLSTGHMEFVVVKVGQGQVSLQVVQFSLAVSFYQCFMFTFHSSKIDAVYS